jgi:3-hydroxyisobutyrate dehydrogenase-like beta-hydroxyacid dehydrogenase
MVERDFSNPSFTIALRHKDAAYAVELAESLLPNVPVSRAAVRAYEAAKAHAPDADEASLIEIVSRPKGKA